MTVPARVGLHPIAAGNAGIMQTLDRMRALIHDSRGSAWVRWAASEIPAGSPLHRIAAIYDWTLRHLRYVPDGAAGDSVPLEEEIRSPDYLLAQIASRGVAEGDCDDFVILTAALLQAHVIPARMVVTSARDDREFDHVFLEAWDGQRWLTLDGIHGAPLGWSVPASGITARQYVVL